MSLGAVPRSERHISQRETRRYLEMQPSDHTQILYWHSKHSVWARNTGRPMLPRLSLVCGWSGCRVAGRCRSGIGNKKLLFSASKFCFRANLTLKSDKMVKKINKIKSWLRWRLWSLHTKRWKLFFFLCPTAFLKVPVHHISMVMVFWLTWSFWNNCVPGLVNSWQTSGERNRVR